MMDKSKLTTREREVLALIVRGFHNKEIAEELSITIETVKSHVSSILTKLKVENRIKAAVLAMKDKNLYN